MVQRLESLWHQVCQFAYFLGTSPHQLGESGKDNQPIDRHSKGSSMKTIKTVLAALVAIARGWSRSLPC